MFCTNCGSKIQDGASFCVGCGAPVAHRRQAAAPPPSYASAPPDYVPPAPPAHPPPMTNAVETQPSVVPGPVAARRLSGPAKCEWCGAISASGELSCPKCGAELDLPELRTGSGWIQVPGRKDMAKLQIGNSSCQIEGIYVPVADMNLAAGDSVYFAHHSLLWKDPQVTITTMGMRGGFTRLLAGLPLIMTQAAGPGHIAFSRDLPGETMAVPLEPGQALDVREHLFLVATSQVAYDWFQTGVWFTTRNGDDTETHYPIGMFMDRFSAPQAPGLLLLHAGGNVFVRDLGPGETILIKPTALVFKDPTVEMHIHFERPSAGFSGWGSWSNRYLWLRLVGPGRVAVQSVFEQIEGEARNITGYSYATERQW